MVTRLDDGKEKVSLMLFPGRENVVNKDIKKVYLPTHRNGDPDHSPDLWQVLLVDPLTGVYPL